MKKLIFILFVVIVSLSYSDENEPYMSCHDILEEMDALYKIQKASEEHNIEGVEKILLAATLHFYVGNRRYDPRKINISKRIIKLKEKLKDCNPY